MAPIWAALGAVGHKALTDVEDEAADETVKLGRRLLARLLRRGGSKEPARPQLEAAAADVATAPRDEDFRVALRAQVRKALTGADGVDDPNLALDLKSLLAAARPHHCARRWSGGRRAQRRHLRDHLDRHECDNLCAAVGPSFSSPLLARRLSKGRLCTRDLQRTSGGLWRCQVLR